MLDFAYIIIAAFYIVLLLILIWKKTIPTVKWSFIIFLTGLLLWHITLYIYLFVPLENSQLLFIGRLNYATGPIFTIGLLGFFYYFPTESIRVPRFVKWAVLVSTIFMFFLTLFTPLIDANEEMTPDGPVVTLGRWYGLYLFQVYAYPIVNILLGVRKSRQLQGLDRVRFRSVFLVFVPTILLFFFSNLILPIFGYIAQFVYSFLFLTPIAFASFYAMQRYRFFNLSNASLNILRTLLIGAFTILAITLLHSGLRPAEYQPESIFVNAAILSIGVFIFTKLNKVFPEFLTSSFREFRSALLELRTGLTAVISYPDLQSLLDHIFSLRLNISNARLFVVRKKPENIKLTTYLENDFTSELAKRKELLVTEELESQIRAGSGKNEFLVKALKELGAAVCLPLLLEGKLIGFFILGKKENAEPYSAEELQEVLSAQRAFQVTLVNILIQSNLHEERDFLKSVIEEKTRDLQVLVKQQSDFMAVSAHELRTPLSVAIFKLAEILEEKKEYGIIPKLSEGLQSVANALDNLKKLTQQLFEVQQYELGKIRAVHSLIPIANLLSEISEELRGIMEQKNFDFSVKNTIPKNAILAGDTEKLRQLLNNLLTNAMKFTPEKGRIILSGKILARKVRIEVEDSGKGISESEKKRVFEKFETLHPSRGMGIGLGLYLSKNIARLHKGKIWVEDSKLGGAKFCVELPLSQGNTSAGKRKGLVSKHETLERLF